VVKTLTDFDDSAGFFSFFLDSAASWRQPARPGASRQVLGLLRPGQWLARPYDLDLLRADFPDHVEPGLLLSRRSRDGSAATGMAHHHRAQPKRPLLFEQLAQLGGLDHGQAAQHIDELVQISHGIDLLLIFVDKRIV
jgi:hypothetical protein